MLCHLHGLCQGAALYLQLPTDDLLWLEYLGSCSDKQQEPNADLLCRFPGAEV
jgi:hypothetical protein